METKPRLTLEGSWKMVRLVFVLAWPSSMSTLPPFLFRQRSDTLPYPFPFSHFFCIQTKLLYVKMFKWVTIYLLLVVLPCIPGDNKDLIGRRLIQELLMFYFFFISVENVHEPIYHGSIYCPCSPNNNDQSFSILL